MTSLEHLFLQFGIQAVPFTDNERQYAQDFLQQRETAFNAICTQRADKQPSDLALGLMTQSFQTTFEAYQATASKIAEMQRLFERQVGDMHASKFQTLDDMELKVVTALWLLTQGYTGIDFSYANDQAVMISHTLQPQHAYDTPCLAESDSESPEKSQERLRQWFMQTYYIGVEQANQSRPRQNWLTRLTSAIKL